MSTSTPTFSEVLFQVLSQTIGCFLALPCIFQITAMLGISWWLMSRFTDKNTNFAIKALILNGSATLVLIVRLALGWIFVGASDPLIQFGGLIVLNFSAFPALPYALFHTIGAIALLLISIVAALCSKNEDNELESVQQATTTIPNHNVTATRLTPVTSESNKNGALSTQTNSVVVPELGKVYLPGESLPVTPAGTDSILIYNDSTHPLTAQRINGNTYKATDGSIWSVSGGASGYANSYNTSSYGVSSDTNQSHYGYGSSDYSIDYSSGGSGGGEAALLILFAPILIPLAFLAIQLLLLFLAVVLVVVIAGLIYAGEWCLFKALQLESTK